MGQRRKLGLAVRPSTAALAFWIATIAALSLPVSASAHGMRSGALQIDEVGEHRAFVRWRQSIPAQIEVELPADCRSSTIEAGASPPPTERAYLIDCDRGLAGETFGVKGLGAILTDATLLVTFKDGRSATHILFADAPRFTLPKGETAIQVAASYVELGVEHIMTGADHLLFLFLVVLLLKADLKSVLFAESAFTLSHSISFSATALELIRVAAPAAEACIALSLLLLALDVSSNAAATARSAAWMALIFGSVHGLGFAGGLRELGLPENHVSTALIGFGAGVEVGQVLFLAAVIFAVRVLMRFRIGPQAARASVFLSGVLASYWLIARLAACLD